MEHEAIRASREIVGLAGFGLGNLIYRVYHAEIEKKGWDDEDRANVHGTRIFLIGGSIGTLGYTGQLLPLIAQRRLKEIDPDLARQVRIFKPDTESALAGAYGAYFLAVPPEARARAAQTAGEICARGRIPILPLLDVGGTKTSLVLAYADENGAPTFNVLQSHRFTTPVSEPESFYPRLASLLAFPLQAIAGSEPFELIPILAVGQPGGFDRDGRITEGTALDLGKTFPGAVPSRLLRDALDPHIGGIEIYCGNDGRAQFLGLGHASRIESPNDWARLTGEKVAFFGLGTGLGAGFGHIEPNGDIAPFRMHNAFDILASAERERLPNCSYISGDVLPFPYWYGALLSGKFFRTAMHHIDASRAERDRVFIPRSSARGLTGEQVQNLLASDGRLSPLSAALTNEILSREIVASLTEEIVERSREDLERKLETTLATIAQELGTTLVKNVRTSEYARVIDEVARAKRRGKRVQFIGVGKSHSISQNLAYIYSNLGISASACELTGANSENLTNLREDDLVFLISHSGRAAELLQLIPYIHRKHCRTVALTGDEKSPIARHCDYFINTYVERNPHPIPEAPTTSTTSALAAGTAIGMVVSSLFHYDAESFFLDHPNLEFNVDFPVPGVRADASFDHLAKIEDIFCRFAESIGALMSRPDFVPSMISFTKRILVAYRQGRPVFFTGSGASLRVAEKVAATLTSIGIDASPVNPAQLPHGDFRHIRPGDLLVIISFSGRTRHLRRVHDLATRKEVDCAVITADADSPLARDCNTGLVVVAGTGADDTDLVAVPDQKILSSFINLTVGDALAVILTAVLNGTQKEFAEQGHQGGEFARKRARIDRTLLKDLGSAVIESIGADEARLRKINDGLFVPICEKHLRAYEKRRLIAAGDMPEVMIFGMGAIGLAYLAPLFHALDKSMWFVEREEGRIAAMRAADYQYAIQQGGADEVRTIGRFSVILGSDSTLVTAHALSVDTIVTAVGVPNFESLIDPLAQIIHLRYQFWIEQPLNVIFSENFPVEEDPLARLRHRLRDKLDDPELKVYFDEHIGLVPAIDEAVVPEVGLDVLSRKEPIVVEKESAVLFIDRKRWHSPESDGKTRRRPDFGDRVAFTSSFLPLHMRKLWVHNMAHSLIGYLGHHRGYTLIYDAVRDEAIREIVMRAMRSIGCELYRRWSYRETPQVTLESYIEWRWKRYENEALRDTVARVCRDPERKLGPNDRLLGPIKYIQKYAPKSTANAAIVDILTGVVAAMHYAADGAAGPAQVSYAALRARVLGDLPGVDSARLDAAERQFDSLRPVTLPLRTETAMHVVAPDGRSVSVGP
ncbi:MAG TPA: SIS domain-containing protein [Thermoanaerobaculia bacterium]